MAIKFQSYSDGSLFHIMKNVCMILSMNLGSTKATDKSNVKQDSLSKSLMKTDQYFSVLFHFYKSQ